MNNILYIAPYRDGTGYSHAAVGYINSILEIGATVKAKFVRLNNQYNEISPTIVRQESLNLKSFQYIIQHILPVYFYKNNICENIGMFALESDAIPYTWIRNLKMMDKIVSFCTWQQKILENFNITSFVIPHAIDMQIYYRNYKPITSLQKFIYNHDKILYSIGENTKRKHYTALIKAFLLEFTDYDNVGLIIKTDNKLFHNTNMSWKNLVVQIKDDLKINRKLRNILIITERFSQEDIYSLHYHGDIYVNSSYGECFSIPTAEALGFGNTPVVPNHTCFPDYINSSNGFLVESHKTPAFANDNPHQIGNWWDINIPHFMQQLRLACDTHLSKSPLGLQSVQNFSYENIGSKMKDFLCQENKSGKKPLNTG